MYIYYFIFHSTVPFHIPVQRLETPLNSTSCTGSVQVLFWILLPRSATTILCACQLPRNCCWTTISVLWLVMANSNESQKVANEWNTLYQYLQNYCSKIAYRTENAKPPFQTCNHVTDTIVNRWSVGNIVSSKNCWHYGFTNSTINENSNYKFTASTPLWSMEVRTSCVELPEEIMGTGIICM